MIKISIDFFGLHLFIGREKYNFLLPIKYLLHDFEKIFIGIVNIIPVEQGL